MENDATACASNPQVAPRQATSTSRQRSTPVSPVDTKVGAQSPATRRILSHVKNQGGLQGRALVVVVDDDDSVRESLPDLLRELGFVALAFASAEEFLSSDCVTTTRCLVLDIGLPGMTGPELHRELLRRGRPIPTVFITARGKQDPPPGLLDAADHSVVCLLKPFTDEELRAALAAALARA